MVEFQKDFLIEADFLIEQCEESFLNLEKSENVSAELAQIYRVIHSFKGAGAAVGFLDLSEFAHEVEDCLSLLRVHPKLLSTEIVSLLLNVGDAFKKRIKYLATGEREPWDISELKKEVTRSLNQLKKKTEEISYQSAMVQAPTSSFDEKLESKSGATNNQSTTIRVDTERIDYVLDTVGELVVIKSQLMNEINRYTDQNARLGGIVSLLDRTIRDLQDRALSMRMTPMKSTFLKLQRVTRDLSVKLGKPVEFVMEGEEVEMDRTMVEVMADPLMHLVRNSIDHGIEKKEKRTELGKSEKGSVYLKARVSGGRVVIDIQDDGAGIHRERIIQKAIERKLIANKDEASQLTDGQVFQYIFAPGFSTAEKVTDVSGRGVGMDVVKTSVEKLKGIISIESQINQGTTFSISLPMTTSITDGLLVDIENHPYVLPIDAVIELVDIKDTKAYAVKTKGTMMNIRGKVLPIIDLRQHFSNDHHGTQSREMAAVIVKIFEKPRVILVSKVYGQTQVVQKPLGQYLEGKKGLSGAAVLGDGRVALVIDVDSLSKLMRKQEMMEAI